ncbi:putative carboxylesterase [Rosa chinensis]|uniref:Putative carboxylesterase n=1 Tax=Rosa chinensis TaxID=74649 RepID=A0A2P6RZ61_ROSCH|nr:putative carboxylesterase [Rosa chinensis]
MWDVSRKAKWHVVALDHTEHCGGKRGVIEYELCDNVTDCVFFYYGHPTERFNQKVAKSWWSHTPNGTRPYTNLKDLFEV